MQAKSHAMSAQSSMPVEKETTVAVSSDIDDFIYLISHDVRASVRALLELPQWIAEDLEEAGIPITGQVGASIELMNRHTGRLDRMLVDLLSYSRVGRMQTSCAVDLDPAVNLVLEGLKVPQGFKIMRNLDCESVFIGERDLLTLLDALIGNAIKHHDKNTGSVIVTTARENEQIVICVSDDGPGIEPEFREKVFGTMVTLRPRDEVEGSGMGLATARKIATFYGGTANVHPSPYGRGTCVEVRLPDMADQAN